MVVPLDGLFTDPRYGLGGSEVLFDAPTQEELVPQFLQECSLNGHTYARAYMRLHRGLLREQGHGGGLGLHSA